MNADHKDDTPSDADLRSEVTPGRGSKPSTSQPSNSALNDAASSHTAQHGALRREVLASLEADGPQDSRREAHPASKLAGVGLQFAGVVLLFTLGGHWLDQRLGSEPWLLLIGLALGLVGGGLSLILSVQRTLS